MGAKETYRQRLDELAEAQRTGLLNVHGEQVLLNTDEGWQAYGAACDENLAEYWRNLAQEQQRPTP